MYMYGIDYYYVGKYLHKYFKNYKAIFSENEIVEW